MGCVGWFARFWSLKVCVHVFPRTWFPGVLWVSWSILGFPGFPRGFLGVPGGSWGFPGFPGFPNGSWDFLGFWWFSGVYENDDFLVF